MIYKSNTGRASFAQAAATAALVCTLTGVLAPVVAGAAAPRAAYTRAINHSPRAHPSWGWR